MKNTLQFVTNEIMSLNVKKKKKSFAGEKHAIITKDEITFPDPTDMYNSVSFLQNQSSGSAREKLC